MIINQLGYNIAQDLKKNDEDISSEVNAKAEQLFNPYIDKKFIKVAEIQFAYNNHELIKMLIKRGEKIQAMEWKQVQDTDDRIKEFIKNDDNYHDIVQPVCAFVTFETETGQNEAMHYQNYLNTRTTQDDVLDLPQETILN